LPITWGVPTDVKRPAPLTRREGAEHFGIRCERIASSSRVGEICATPPRNARLLAQAYVWLYRVPTYRYSESLP
jgi:hypothetical protein